MVRTVFILSVIFSPTFLSVACAADLSWLATVSSCDEFDKRLTAFVGEHGDTGSVDSTQQRALDTVLDVACGPRFKGCGFKQCLNRAMSTVQPVASPVHSSPKSSVVVVPTHQHVVSWLNQEFSCQGLLDQIATRYGPYRGTTFPEALKAEFDVVRKELCSARFAHCHFSTCEGQGVAPNVTVMSNPSGKSLSDSEFSIPKMLDEKEQLAIRDEALNREYAAVMRERSELLQARRNAEQQQKLNWVRFDMPQTVVRDRSRAAGASRGSRKEIPASSMPEAAPERESAF